MSELYQIYFLAIQDHASFSFLCCTGPVTLTLTSLAITLQVRSGHLHQAMSHEILRERHRHSADSLYAPASQANEVQRSLIRCSSILTIVTLGPFCLLTRFKAT